MTEIYTAPPLLLTKQEVRELTGYQAKSRQIRKLKEYGVRFFVAADGYPRVVRAEIENPGRIASKAQPDFSALVKTED